MNEYNPDKYRLHLMICAGTACVSNKSFRIKEVLEDELKKGIVVSVNEISARFRNLPITRET